MPEVKNMTAKHQTLYLPKRTLRFSPKEVKNLHKYEIDCERFQNRKEFKVLKEEKDAQEDEDEIEEVNITTEEEMNEEI